jgi:hypothetical protein
MIRNNAMRVISEEGITTILFLPIISLMFLFERIHFSFWSQAWPVGENKDT